jgi:ABC-type lipoprotein export system ATPase subunit
MYLENLCKIYTLKNNNVSVLNNINYEFKNGTFYAIMGGSGAGKTTLISILGLLENITSGKYSVDGRDVTELKESECDVLRRDYFGFIFQNFNLDEYLKAYENVMVPMLINKDIKNPKERAISLLKKFNLEERVDHFPKELSGGEQQRVCIARALANNPKVILADEPTGNLDKFSETNVFEILKDLSKEGKCVIVVSHSDEVKKYADVVINISNGKLSEERAN